jgi:hypothetical protein
MTRHRPKSKRRGGRPRLATTILGPKIVRRILDPEHGELCGPAYIKQGGAMRPVPRWMLILRMLGPEAAAEAEIRRVKAAHKRLGVPFDRDRVIEEAAKFFRLDEEKLRNWLRRSKQPR